MTIAKTLQEYLADQGVNYEVLTHSPNPSASRTAQASHVSGNSMAKGVLVNADGRFVLAVLPASHVIQFDQLESALGARVRLATEEEIKSQFPDCDTGAIPAVAAAYGLNAILDLRLADQPEVYLEGGDHASLLQITGEQFYRLIGGLPRARFSHRV